LKHFSHSQILRILKQLNTQYKDASHGSWSESWPDLEEPITRQVVEVALSDLKKAWGQCLYYYRMGASEIHLVLSPKLFLDYENNESAFVRENPILNVAVYTLPKILVPTSHIEKAKPKQKSVKIPMLKFIIADDEKKNTSETENVSKTFGYKGYRKVNLDDDLGVDESSQSKDQGHQNSKSSEIEHIKMGFVPILSPLGHLSYIARETYEREKETSESKLNFWRLAKTKQLPEKHEEVESIQVYRKRYPCVDCPDAKVEENIVYCPKHGWEITIELAKKQELCAF